ncbi:MAG: DNA helicase RecQ [Lachnospiraceae bacterium]|nr:DNA helicase RecQ [Lachnospiraceae bacterium]
MSAAEILKTYFGYDSFRNGQEEIVQSILSGKDALAIMPTGAGKSICYQVPALMLPGITIVVSPLISLMQDQVKALNEAGVHAAFINSSLTETQIAKAMRFAAEGRYKIIYVAPERLETAGFMQFAQNGNISMVTVDEAHCISQWGQDFRPSYLKIVAFIDSLADRPIVSAFTATATREVKTDIECILKLQNPRAVVTGFDRENLYYSVEHIAGKHKDDFILDYIQKHADESGIVYCATRKNVDNLYEKLLQSGVSVTRYHAGIDNETRKKNQDDFIYDRVQIVIATNAFGMGIDKSNVRYVLHYNMPQSMENYYQEAGRAGRDGENAQCILLFSAQDVMINKFLLEKKEFEGMDPDDIELVKQRDVHRLQVMEGYCKATTCLRNYILEYFGEKAAAPCDNCGNCHREYYEQDMTSDAKWVINCIAETRGRYGLNIVTGTLLGANRARLKEIGANTYKSYGALEQRSETDIRLLIDQMVAEGYIVQTSGEYSVLQMGDIRRLKEEGAHVIVRKAQEREETGNRSKKKKTDSLTGAGFDLFERLRQLRLVIAKEEAMPPYIIFSDKTLIDMCVRVPENQEEMLAVSGVGENKYRKYGERFLQAIAAFLSENPNAVFSTQIDEEVVPAPTAKKGHSSISSAVPRM